MSTLQELVVTIAGVRIIIKQGAGVGASTVYTKDPLAFWLALNNPSINGKPEPTVAPKRKYTKRRVAEVSSKVAAPAHRRESQPKKAANGELMLTNYTFGMEHSGGIGGPGKPRLGTLGITIFDAEKIRTAVEKKDGSLSPVQRNILAARMGINRPAIATGEIKKLYGLANTSDVSRITHEAFKALGIKRQRKYIKRFRTAG